MKIGLGKIVIILSLLTVLFTSIFVLSSRDCKHKKWSEWTVMEKETCGADGRMERTCQKCGAVDTKIVSATNQHHLVEVPYKHPTCTEEGRSNYEVCEDCGWTLGVPEPIPATGHNIYRRPEVPATCTSEGYTDWASCTNCDYVEKKREVIPKLSHTPEVVKGFPATCTASGLTDGSKCSVCETTLAERETIPMLAHTEVTVPGYGATCTEWGLTEGLQCSVCHTWIVGQSTINALGHDLRYAEGYAPTCENPGLSGHSYCGRCGDNFGGPEVLAPYGHIETSLQGYAPTCTEPGRKDGVQCHTCHKVLVMGEEIPASGHKIITTNGYAASCLREGKTDGQMCSLCYTVFVEQEVIPPLGHDVIVDTERTYGATCEQGGCTYYVCSFPNCTYSNQEFTEALPHTEVIDPAVEPTLSSSGLTEGKHCAVCERILVAQNVLKRLAEFTVVSGANGKASLEYEIASPGETLTITAIPDEGYDLLGWFYVGTGTKAGDDLTEEFNVMDPDSDWEKFNHIEARFYKLEVIAVNENYSEPIISGNRLSVKKGKSIAFDSIDGNVYGDIGDSFNLVANVPDGYTFLGWYEGEKRITTNLKISFTVAEGGKTLEARFKKAFVFTITNENAERGSVSWSSYNGEYGESSVYEGARIALTATKNYGYTFVGWYDADGTLISNSTSCSIYMPSEDYEVYAKFDRIYYEVALYHNATNYVDQYATTSGAGTYYVGQTVNIGVTYLPGVKFLGWYKDNELVSENTEYSFVMPATSLVTYAAKFERLEYNLNVVPNYPELEGAIRTVKFGDSVSESNHIVGMEYKFLGWYLNGERLDSQFRMPAEDVTVEARYLKSYKINTSVNNSYGRVDVMKMDPYDKSYYYVGDSIRLTANSNNGTYKFVCWMMDGEIVSTENPYMLTMPEGDVDITAIFGRYRSIFVTKNYEDAPDPVIPEMAREFSQITAVAESSDGYRFLGWYSGDALLSQDAEYTFAMPEGADLEIEARYAKLRYVTADKNYADAPDPIYPASAFEGDSVAVSALSDRKYRFVGWYLDGNLVSGDAEYVFEMPASDIALTAEYEYIDYTLSISTNYSDITLDIPAESKYHFGDLVTVTATAYMPAYKFLGWYLDGELVSGELTYSFSISGDANLVSTYAKLYTIGKDTNYGNAASLHIPASAYVGDEVSVSLSDIAEGYRFVGWYIDGKFVSRAHQFSFVMPEEDVTATAEFQKLRAINVSTNYADAINGDLPAGAYEGDTAVLTVTSNEPFRFIGWYIGGKFVSSDETYSFTMPESDVAITAKFVKRYAITVYQNHPEAPCATYPNSQFEGERVTVLAGESTKFYRFDGWYLDGELVSSALEYSLNMPSSDIALEVRYTKLYRVETSIDRDGTLTDRIDATYAPGENVSVEAVEYEGYRFVGWYLGDELVSSDAVYSFTVADRDLSLVERYLKLYTVSVSANYPDVTVGGSGKYVNGELVSLNAGSSVGRYVFEGWYINGERVSENPTYGITVDGKNVYIEARYNRRYQVSFVGDGVSTTGGGFYFENEQVTVTAKANAGYRFDGWYVGGELVSTDSEYSFVISDEDVEITLDVFVIWDGERSDSFAGGSGTEKDPYLISHASELKYLAYLVNEVGTQSGYYKLVSDIDIGGHEWEPIGARYGGENQNAFAGHFDGNGKSVVNFNITEVNYATSYIGLFGGVCGDIVNLNISDFTIDLNIQTDNKYTIYVGGIVAYGNRLGTLDNCSAKGRVRINMTDTSNSTVYAGLAVGNLIGTPVVEYCSAEGDLSVNFNRSENNSSPYNSTINVGGFAASIMGANSNNPFVGVHANANISIDTNESSAVTVNAGGLATSLLSAWRCYAETQLNVTSFGAINVGGLASNTAFSVSSCYARGEINIEFGNGKVAVGGIVAQIGRDARVGNCYSACDIFVEGDDDAAALVVVGGIAVEKEWSMYDGDNTPVPGCIAFGDITVIAKQCVVYSLFGEFDKKPYGSYVYEGQKINVTASSYTISQGTNIATIDQVNSQKFYTEKLNFDALVLNYDELDVENGKYPVFKVSQKNSVTIMDDGVKSSGNGFYLAGETVTVVAEVTVGYRFEGWYLDGVFVSSDLQYSFTMPSEDVMLVAIAISIVDKWDGTVASSFASGSGTVEDPYLVSTGSQLALLADLINSTTNNAYYNKYYKLTNDIDLAGINWTPIGTMLTGVDGSAEMTRAFQGHFDGCGFTVYNLNISSVKGAKYGYIGLFGCAIGATVSDLHLVDVTISASNCTTTVNMGSIAGRADDFTTIERCSVTCNIDYANANANDVFVGGIVGRSYDGIVRDCIVSGNVSAKNTNSRAMVGGIIGYSSGATVTRCISNTVCYSASASTAFVGGISGYTENASVATNVLSIGSGTAYNYGGYNMHTDKFYAYDNGGNTSVNRCYESITYTKEFFVTTLGFDETVWDLSEVAGERLPSLIQK